MTDTADFKVCAGCKNQIPVNNIGLHEVTCLRHHYRCPNCSEFVAKSGREDHDHLYHSSEKCDRCDTKFKPIDKESHDSVCVNSILSCEFCESQFIRSKFREHKIACGARTEKCESCSKYVMIRDMDTHVCNLSPPDFTVPVGTIFSSSSRPEAEVATRRQVQFPDYDVSPVFPTFFTPTDEPGTETISERERKIGSLFSANKRDLPEQKKTRDPHRDTTQSRSDIFSFGPRPVDYYSQSAEPRRQPMPPLDTPLFSSSPISSETFLSPLEDRHLRDGQSPTPEFEPNPSGPCEFCGNQVPLSALERHQLSCGHRNFINETETKFCVNCGSLVLLMEFGEHSGTCQPRDRELNFGMSIGPRELKREQNKPEPKPELIPEPNLDLIPCEFCKKSFEISEITSHQDNCNSYISPYQPYSEIEMKECRHCKEKFETLEWYSHEIDCVSEQQQLQQHIQEVKHKQQQKSFVEKSNCEFCDEEFRTEQLSHHSQNYPKNPENQCRHCMRHSSDPGHENICSYRHFNSRDVKMPESKLPFTATESDTIFEQERNEINNKCPYCSFPYPALMLDNHKDQCNKNPKFRRTPNRSTLAQYPKVEDRFPKIPPETTIKGDFTPPVSTNTNKLKETGSEKNFSLYSQRDPSPHACKQQQTGRGVTSQDILPNRQELLGRREVPVPSHQDQYRINKQQQQQQTTRGYVPPGHSQGTFQNSKQQQELTGKEGSFSPTQPFQETYRQQQQQLVRGNSPISSYQDKYQQPNIRKQQQEPTRRGSASPVLQFEENYQQPSDKQQQITKNLYSPTLAFQGTFQPNTNKQQQQQGTKKSSFSSNLPFPGSNEQHRSKQQQQHLTGREPISSYRDKNQEPNKQLAEPTKRGSVSPIVQHPGTHEQNRDKQQQQQPRRDVPSPTSLFRANEDSKYAFSNMKPNLTSSIPLDFKFELKSVQTQARRDTLDKPTKLHISDRHTDTYPHLTPTHDISVSSRFVTPSRPNYEAREIRYPPNALNPKESYTKTISSPTETIVDTSNGSSFTNKRNSVPFQEKYKSPKVFREF